MRPEALRPKVHFRLALALGLGVDEKPTLIPPSPKLPRTPEYTIIPQSARAPTRQFVG